MESVLAAAVTGVLPLLGVRVANSKSRAVMEVKFDALTEKVSAHNHLLRVFRWFYAILRLTTPST